MKFRIKVFREEKKKTPIETWIVNPHILPLKADRNLIPLPMIDGPRLQFFFYIPLGKSVTSHLKLWLILLKEDYSVKFYFYFLKCRLYCRAFALKLV